MQTDYVLVHDARLNWQNKNLQTSRAWSTSPLMFRVILRNTDTRHIIIHCLYVCMPLIIMLMYAMHNAWMTTRLMFAFVGSAWLNVFYC